MELRRLSRTKNAKGLLDASSTEKFMSHKRFSEDISHLKLPPMSISTKNISSINRNVNYFQIRKPSMDNSYMYNSWNEHLAAKPLRNENKVKLKYRRIKRININPRVYTDNVDSEVNERLYEGRLIKMINEIII